MPDYTVTQLGSQNQAAGFAGEQTGLANDLAFKQKQRAAQLDAFAKSMGMSGIAGAGKFSAFMKTPEGQAAFAKFTAPKPVPSPTPKMTPPPGAPSAPLTAMAPDGVQ